MELAHLGELTGLVDQAVDVNAAGKIAEVDSGMVRNIDLFDHLAAEHVIDLEGVAFVITFLEVEGNGGSGRVGEEPKYSTLGAGGRAKLGLSLNVCRADQ